MDTPDTQTQTDASLVRTAGGGLINPELQNVELSEPKPGSIPDLPSTRVGEPRLQIIVSLIVVVAFVILWLMPLLSNIF